MGKAYCSKITKKSIRSSETREAQGSDIHIFVSFHNGQLDRIETPNNHALCLSFTLDMGKTLIGSRTSSELLICGSSASSRLFK
jgi:hypothetical protein